MQGQNLNQVGQDLRPYQIECDRQIRESIRGGKRRVILMLPTGGGKTTVASHFIRGAISKGTEVVFLAHRKELLDQAKARLKEHGVESGIVRGNQTNVKFRGVNVCSIQTLVRREGLLNPGLIIVDEAHLSMAASYRKYIEAHPKAICIGLTATPCRLDGKPLGDIWGDIVCPVSVLELIDLGFLVPVEYWGAPSGGWVSMDGVGVQAGEYKAEQMFERYDKPVLYSGCVEKWVKIMKNGRKGIQRTIVFCVNRKHSEKTCQAFKDAGVSAEYLDGDSSESERQYVMDRFRRGQVEVLTNVGLFTEGLDVPEVTCIILNRATKSTALYMQMIGRGLRPADWVGKNSCTVIDLGQNIQEHGQIEDERIWSLKGKVKRGGGVTPIRICGDCGYMMKIGVAVCPECGKEKPVVIREEIEEVEGVVVKLDRKAIPIPVEIEGKKFMKRTRQDFEQIAAIRGYKSAWVHYQIKMQQAYAKKYGLKMPESKATELIVNTES